MIDQVRDFITQQPLALQYGFAGLLALLLAGTLAAMVLPGLRPGKWNDLGPRMRSWWVISILVTGALFAGAVAFTCLFALISFLALKEYLTLAPTRREDRAVVLLAYLSIPVSAFVILINEYLIYLVTVPMWWFVLTAALMAVLGRTQGFLSTVGIVHWGVVVCVYNLGYIAFLMQVPDREAPAGNIGLVFFLLFVTQLNDVMQYVWGKLLGRTKILPTVSPNKTWEGFIGGALTCAAVIVLCGPYFTPLSGVGLYVTAIALPIAGFAGDITMSAIKRDLGVKDTSTLIPGHGGALDRLDSLTFTAPLYFHLLAFYAVAAY
jgi:phosphatidate cytidylyltransferase